VPLTAHLLVNSCHVLGHAVLQLLHVADEFAAVVLQDATQHGSESSGG
jgi:hypothetical protein